MIDYQALAEPWLSLGRGDEYFSVYQPATGEHLADYPCSTAADVDAVVARARLAFESWRQTTPRERAALMRRAAQLLRDNAQELAELESFETGKPLEISRDYDMVVCAESFEFFAAAVTATHGEFFPGGPVDTHTFAEPFGVVAGIIPFNWPPVHTSAKLAPALGMGNVAILKPPEQCPLTILRIVALLQTVFPEGVVQAVPGTGALTGAALIGHPGVDRISFTGSPSAAKAVLRGSAEHLTSALLELGGKDPIIVFPDADIDSAVRGAVEGGFFNQGEACTAASRLIVHRDVLHEFTHAYVEAVARLRVGDGLEPGVHVGPMITATHRQRVLDYVEIGEAEGAQVLFRGDLPTDPRLAGGYFVPPIVFGAVTPDMRVAREEIFGPIVAILAFDTEAEAVAIANSTDFALVAGVYTADDHRARRLSRLVDAGVVFINNYNRMFLGTPFGGNRASGHGREHAVETLREYSRTKSVRTLSGVGTLPTWSGVTDTR